MKRRSWVRWIGLAGVLAALALGCGEALAVTGGGTPQIVTPPRFLLTGGGNSWGFSELKSINAEVEPQEFIYGNTQGMIVHTKQVGVKKTAPSVTLEKPLDTDAKLWDWSLRARTGRQTARHNVLLIAYSGNPALAGSKAYGWELVGAWPAKIEVSGPKAGSTNTGTLTVTFLAQEIIAAPSGEPTMPVAKAGAIKYGKAPVPAVKPPATPHGTPSALNAVSCANATTCMAVGRELVGGVNRPLVEQWNGEYWSSRTAAMPAGASGAILNGVSCPTATDCTAVGESHSSSGVQTLAEVWNGSTWAVQNTLNVSGAPSTLLNSVSCTTPSSCMAVGTVAGPLSHYAISESWDGSSWQPQPIPKPTAQGPYATGLTSVSCPSQANCTAVGANGSSPLAATWNGTNWTLQTPVAPAGSTSAALRGVTCTTVGSCIAVGSSTSTSGTAALAESFSGSGWSIENVPTPPGTRAPTLNSVACLAASSCAAVGSIVNGRYGLKPLLERWNGTAWVKVASPDPAGESRTQFTGVACANACAAVGVAAKPSLTALMQMLFTS